MLLFCVRVVDVVDIFGVGVGIGVDGVVPKVTLVNGVVVKADALEVGVVVVAIVVVVVVVAVSVVSSSVVVIDIVDVVASGVGAALLAIVSARTRCIAIVNTSQIHTRKLTTIKKTQVDESLFYFTFFKKNCCQHALFELLAPRKSTLAKVFHCCHNFPHKVQRHY